METLSRNPANGDIDFCRILPMLRTVTSREAAAQQFIRFYSSCEEFDLAELKSLASKFVAALGEKHVSVAMINAHLKDNSAPAAAIENMKELLAMVNPVRRHAYTFIWRQK
ncbi:hypothetical protein OAN61_01030 [bacterium]|nr:hypothetical protein [bacterium]